MVDIDTTHHPDRYPKSALVTGGARRIGRAIALSLARDGWSVAVHHNHSVDSAKEVVSEIARAGSHAVAIKTDLSCEDEVETLVPKAVDALGPVGLLVNNASAFENDTIETATRDSWAAHIQTNLHAPLVLTQAFARALPRTEGGVVVNLLDQRVWNLTPYFLSYTVSKSGLWTLTRTLALALAPRIRVNGIGPGPALPSRHQTEEQFARQCAAMPLGRGTTPEEICGTIQFIIATPSLTGQMIALDGGQHLAWAQPSKRDPTLE